MPDNPEHRRPRLKLMTFLKVRVDEELAAQLRQLAAEEQEPVSTVARRVLRLGMRTSGRSEGLARAHEGSGRVQ